MKTETSTDYMNVVQHMFIPPSMVSEAVRTNASSFWGNQEKLLAEMEDFATAWFERRHKGTRAALDACERMCKAETPADMFREYQDWVKGAFERVMADGLACQQNLMTVIGSFPQPLAVPGGEKEGEGSRSSTRTPTHPKAA